MYKKRARVKTRKQHAPAKCLKKLNFYSFTFDSDDVTDCKFSTIKKIRTRYIRLALHLENNFDKNEAGRTCSSNLMHQLTEKLIWKVKQTIREKRCFA